MTEEKRKRGRPPKPKPEPEPKPKRHTLYWSPSTHKTFERVMRAYLVALNVSRAGDDHIADLKTVDETAQVVIDMINEYRGLS